MINTDRLQKVINEFRDDVNNDPGVADMLVFIAGCICDLDERLIRIENDLNAAKIPHADTVAAEKRRLDMLGWKAYEGTQDRS